MSCRKLTRSASPVRYANFDFIPASSKQAVLTWYRLARECGQANNDPFQGLINLWISFNHWAAVNTEVDQDALIVRSVAADAFLCDTFQDLLHDADFSRKAYAFHAYWPVFSAKDARKKGLQGYFNEGDPREERVELYLLAKVDHGPECGESHQLKSDPIPLDWPHAIHAVYKVRCNLFHGEKGYDSPSDVNLVRAAFDVLLPVYERALRDMHHLI